LSELDHLLRISRRLPRLPRMLGVANRLIRRFYLRRPREPLVTDVCGFTVELDPNELVDGLWLFAPHLVDRVERDFIRDHLRPGDVFADLGAHIGMYALLASRWVGAGGRVIAVEPDPRSRRRLDHNLGANGIVADVVGSALSDRDGPVDLWLRSDGNRGGSSLVSPGGERVSVPGERLVTMLARLGVSRIHVAKLDLEGSEYRVLADYLDVVPMDRWPRAMVVEHHAGLVERAGGDALELLRRAGYRLSPGTKENWLAVR
jgi:FkbM family methyltransferase